MDVYFCDSLLAFLVRPRRLNDNGMFDVGWLYKKYIEHVHHTKQIRTLHTCL